MTETHPSTAERLHAAAALTDQGFLEAGRSLEAALLILDRLTQRFTDYISELSDEALRKTQRDLGQAGTRLAALAEAHEADTRALHALGDIVTEIQCRLNALLPITQEFETLSLHARIVAGGMGEAAKGFVTFAGNIRTAAQDARLCLEAARDALANMDQDVTAARVEAAGFVQRHGDAIKAIPLRLAESLRSLTARQQIATDAATTAQLQSEAVRQRVAEQVVALQLGDITRQRLEHVESSVRLASAPYSEVGELLAAQLSDTAEELARESTRIETGLHRIADAARMIGQLGLRVHGDATDGGFLAELEADIRQTAALLHEIDTGNARTCLHVQEVQQTAEVLMSQLTRLQSVQEDLRIVGLNATLKCTRLGQIGRPLAAIAQELRLCSGRFGAQAEPVFQDLRRIGKIGTDLRDQSQHDDRAKLVQASDAMLAPLRRLDRVQHDLNASLSRLQEEANEVSRLIDAAVSQFAIHTQLEQTLRAAATDLASWSSAGTCPSELLDRIASIYTMSREREIHERVAPLPETAAPKDLEDVLF